MAARGAGSTTLQKCSRSQPDPPWAGGAANSQGEGLVAGAGVLAPAEPRLHRVGLWRQHCGKAGRQPAAWPQRPLAALGVPAPSRSIVTSQSGTLKVIACAGQGFPGAPPRPAPPDGQ